MLNVTDDVVQFRLSACRIGRYRARFAFASMMRTATHVVRRTRNCHPLSTCIKPEQTNPRSCSCTKIKTPARACGATGWIWQRQTAIEEQVHRLVCSERRRSRRGARFFGAQCSQVRRRHPVIDSYPALTEAPRGWFVHDETRATAGT